MNIETKAGTYRIEFGPDELKKMELAGLKPLKALEKCADGEAFEAVDYSYIVKTLDMCAVLEDPAEGVPSQGIEKDMTESGYGFFDFLETFREAFMMSPFLTQRRLPPRSSETA